MVRDSADKATERSARNDPDERHNEHLSLHLIAVHLSILAVSHPSGCFTSRKFMRALCSNGCFRAHAEVLSVVGREGKRVMSFIGMKR
jgi:hypothetical protein